MWRSETVETTETPNEVHRKRASQILRYISTLPTNAGKGFSFVRSGEEAENFRAAHFFQGRAVENDEEEIDDGGVLFSIFDFQQLAAALQAIQTSTVPFSFYKTTNSSFSRKRTPREFLKTNSDTLPSPCWLRLTRLAPVDPPHRTPSVVAYLDEWAIQSKVRSTQQLLTLKNLERAPASRNLKVQRFIRQYKTYLRQRNLRRILEPMYNHLFERYHQTESGDGGHLDLIWGLGHARLKEGDTLINGPLLDVRVEVELARDGALLVRPKQHTGVSINRNILAALSTGTSDVAIRSLNQSIDELDPAEFSPGEPSTYTSILKRMAVELSSGGTFQSSKSAPRSIEEGQLVVTDAWCLYTCPRPSAVWARDALQFTESLSRDTHDNRLPKAMWALTHGPSALEQIKEKDQSKSSASVMDFLKTALTKKVEEDKPAPRPQFPLPTSDAQNRIAEMLLGQNYPAVVCEGPPGTGKTHTIANIVCAYLCLGKRVLVTSKGAPALSVLRERLPPCVQELCVDVSMSESAGMRQLQQTVERLANKVSWVNTDREVSKAKALEENIRELEEELYAIDSRLRANAEEKRTQVGTDTGRELFETAIDLIDAAPWLMKTIATWDVNRVADLYTKMESLYIEPSDPLNMVEGYDLPPSDALVSLVASKAGFQLSKLKNVTKGVVANMPLLGQRMTVERAMAQERLNDLNIKGSKPVSPADWRLVLKSLEREQEICRFRQDVLEPLFSREGWPEQSFFRLRNGRQEIDSELIQTLRSALQLKKLAEQIGAEKQIEQAIKFRELDGRRTRIASSIQQQAEELVACRVVSELSKNFTADAQSALVKFAQVSGKAKFGKSSQPSKLTQRQRRKRQEYLNAFEKCVRYIPCWILSTSQISDYLPSECLFDLVVIDEASQSDLSVLPGMLRGKQWLIVGDGKQVSPTEGFISEDQIEMLKAALPDSPFQDSMLPGNSFFDLCAQAFPKGRVILREHFRCAPEIISFSNEEFYNGNLIPLRLPTKFERLDPSLIDVRLPRGVKTGKVNERECDKIVQMITDYVESCTLLKKRSIGVISLVGDEQSRLIRGRLLDSIGPHKYKLHEILVGEPPSFQGAERDIVFLSMVCSPGNFVTQNQLMHAQRMNVALSRARDRMVLVRSIDSNHIPNEQDIKFAVLDFFERGTSRDEETKREDQVERLPVSTFRFKVESMLRNNLRELGFSTYSMGVVWDSAICVESAIDNGCRAAICVEGSGESLEEWTAMLHQQKSIERVGWKCHRVDALSFLTDPHRVQTTVEEWLISIGVQPKGLTPLEEEEDMTISNRSDEEGQDDLMQGGESRSRHSDESVVVISSDEEDSLMHDDIVSLNDRKPAAAPVPVLVPSTSPESDGLGSGERASDYGNIADLDFLQRPVFERDEEFVDLSTPPHAQAATRKRTANIEDGTSDDLDEKQRIFSESTRPTFLDDDLSASSTSVDQERDAPSLCRSRASKSSKRRRTLDKYSRDGRWYNKRSEQQDDVTYDEFIAEVEPEPSAQAIIDADSKEKDQNIDVEPIDLCEDSSYEDE